MILLEIDSAGNSNSSSGSFLSDLVNITVCRSLTQANVIYTLQNDLSTTGDCLIIQANNITIDMNGYNITGDDGLGDKGIYVKEYNESAIKNGYIYDFGSGIYLDAGIAKSNNHNITNMTLSSNDNGIYFYKSDNNSITNIIADSNNYGLYFDSFSDYCNLSNIVVKNSATNAFYFKDSSNNLLDDFEISNATGKGIYLYYSSSYNIIKNGNINSTDYGIYFYSGVSSDSHNLFKNIKIDNSNNNDVYLKCRAGGETINNTFLNVSYNSSSRGSIGPCNTELIRKWYYQAYVNDTNGNIVNNANISINNVTGQNLFNLTANSSGYSSKIEIIDYINNGTKTYYSN